MSIDKSQLNINNKIIDYKINFNKKNVNNTLIFDTETSGFDDVDIIQIAYVIIDENKNIIKKQNYYVKDRISSIQAQGIHNITVDKLRTVGKDFFYIMNEFITDLQNVNTIVGHNLDFDIRVVLNNLRKYDIKIINNNIEEYNLFKQFIIYDTYKISKVKLNKLYFDLFNDNIINAHDALSDVEATLKCYLELKK
jgi:DNA polymerase III epsilon subunit-like protein